MLSSWMVRAEVPNDLVQEFATGVVAFGIGRHDDVVALFEQPCS